ncbi:hypothetical protein NT2_01_06000 [Caenibius tardaugens NBRC 16725]|uniref:VOC domain-containing protein n=1 Tax=Caenibius tardaugens NBRC 16725 TaxID=1219035 RepID=U2Y473_9SPHN|nr:hypothetical protein NT2_01_06000 [Caenibius tardaugens NBRC 16725]
MLKAVVLPGEDDFTISPGAPIILREGIRELNGVQNTSFGFTKLIVDDEEAMAQYYCGVYGLNAFQRVQNDDSGAGGPIREIILSHDDVLAGPTLVMFKFTDRPAPVEREAILGFITDDLDSLARRVIDHGGKHVSPIKSMPEHGVRVLFTTDPEGRMSENVELMPR